MIKRMIRGIICRVAFCMLLPLVSSCHDTDSDPEQFVHDRSKMVQTQIRGRGIRDEKTLEAMGTVPRHKFVPAEYLKFAYDDQPLPIGYGQTISQPYIVALMTERLSLRPTDKVLEIGTGSGYQAAILSRICRTVYTVEMIPLLGEMAKKRLIDLGYENITVKIADGYFGWAEHAPYDAIIVTAAATHVPPPLLKQLKVDGRMVIPVGGVFQVQRLMFIKKISDELLMSEEVCPVRFVPLTGDH